MKSLYRLIPFLLSLLLLGCAQNPAAFSPANSGFTVAMPGTAKEQTTDGGGHIFSCDDGQNAYVVSYADFSDAKQTPASVQRMLDGARNGQASNGNRLLSEKKITYEGYPGRDLRLKTKGGNFMRLRIFMANGKLYQVGVVTDPDKSEVPAVDQFISSFHLTAKQ